MLGTCEECDTDDVEVRLVYHRKLCEECVVMLGFGLDDLSEDEDDDWDDDEDDDELELEEYGCDLDESDDCEGCDDE